MTQEALSILRAAMADMHLPYALGQYRAAPLPETYFVGQWVDAEGFTEDGRTDSTMTLLGYSRAVLMPCWRHQRRFRRDSRRMAGRASRIAGQGLQFLSRVRRFCRTLTARHGASASI